MCCERFVRGVRDCFWRERMWQRFEGVVVIEREMNAFVGVDEDDDARRGGQFPAGDGAIVVVEREPVRICEAVRVAMPVSECCDVVAASGHGVAVRICSVGARHAVPGERAWRDHAIGCGGDFSSTGVRRQVAA